MLCGNLNYGYTILHSANFWWGKTLAKRMSPANILPSQIPNLLKHLNITCLNLPKFYPTKILHYMVYYMRNCGSCIFVDVSSMHCIFNIFTIYPPRCPVQGSESCQCVTASLVQGKEGETKIITLVPIHIYCSLLLNVHLNNENVSLKIAVTRTEEWQDKAVW